MQNKIKSKAHITFCFFALLTGILVMGSAIAEPVKLWDKPTGGSDRDEGYGVAVDSDNNIIVVGVTESFARSSGDEDEDMWLIKYTLARSSEDRDGDIWLIKYTPDGTVLWNKTAGGVYMDEGYGVAVDSNNNIIITGSISYGDYGDSFFLGQYYSQFLKEGKVHDGLIKAFEDNNITLSKDAKITKRSDNVREITDGKMIYEVHVFNDKRLHIHALRNSDMLTIKYDSSGNMLWNKTVDRNAWDYGKSVAIDSSNNIIVAGHAPLGLGEIGGLIIKYDTQGNMLWNKTAGKSSSDELYSIAVDSNNNIIAAGFMRYSDIGNVWVIKYDSNGNMLWYKTASMGGWDRGYGIAVDSSNNIIVTGSANIRYSGRKVCVLTMKYDSFGNLLWNKTASGIHNSFDSGKSVAVDSNDNIIVVGYTERIKAIENYEIVVLENATYYAVEGIESFYYTEPPVKRNYELWTIKYDPSGNVIWNKTEGGIDRDMGFGVAIDQNNNIIITGETNSFGAGKGDVWVIKYTGDMERQKQDMNIYLITGALILILILLIIMMIRRNKKTMK
ncbi:hypothetical protein BEH94_06160 [Candidatus Altiarchaeales archaeon WOR_SM1_SCG]|nr:hypothetical protein BEH94_06160 [Candidatus Altiarchaeales archaeon WOR_SM1_SCG]